MRKILFWTVVAIVVGCQQAPVTKPRILSVQTPAGMPPPASLKTTRNNPLIVPTAPVGSRPGVIAAPAIIAPAPAPPPGAIAPPVAIPVPAAPGGAPGVQGVAPPNTFQQPAQYPAAVVTTKPTEKMKQPERLPDPVSDSRDAGKSEDANDK